MPIMLDNLQTVQTASKTYTPKFFDKELTGSGKKTGVLSETMNPEYQMLHRNQFQPVAGHNMKHVQSTSGTTTVFQIPLAPLYPKLFSLMDGTMRRLTMPDVAEMVEVGTFLNGTGTGKVYITMEPYHISIEKTKHIPAPGSNASVSISRQVYPRYNINLYLVCDDTDTTALVNYLTIPHFTDANLNYTDTNKMLCVYTFKPGDALKSLPADMPGIQFDTPVLDNFLQSYSLYDAVCRCSENWQTKIDKIYNQFFDAYPISAANNTITEDELIVAETLRYLENYSVPLDLYRNIYKSITTHYAPDIANRLCKQNLNLLLSNTLSELNNDKPLLSPIPANGPAGIAALSNRTRPFSPEQQRAIASQSPLSLVQAGAGTGKSTVILGRIDWMIASGIKPEDIMVLSFTNAAADHIKELNPQIHSMTIASMIHTIYSANYPNHTLSTLDTIINSLDIYFPTDDTARRLASLCRDISKNARHSFTTINNFIEDNFDAVINLLETMGQTSLELEIMVCYQRIENLIEPPEVLSRHLIIDEVQDNSVFEFVYTLKYVNKHKESLFIVGDCSQTLYEFRASDPRALNVLEGSGVFDSYQLQVNYRSNQEILDFANVTLANIEANQYANIRLRANSLQQVTEQSFTDKVRLKYYRFKHITDFNNMIPVMVGRDLKTYIDACLNRGEKVAFLAYERYTVGRFCEEIQRMWPNKNIANLVPAKPRGNTIMSRFIRDHWDEVQFMPTKNITDVIIRDCMDAIMANPRGKQSTQTWLQQMAADTLLAWQAKAGADITMLQTQYMNNQITLDELMEYVRKTMLDFEISKNAVSQSITKQHNQETKDQQIIDNADFLFSTIHSAKGLEFDNVVVIYRNDRTEEDEKRMYYVALTRAMKSEFVLAYDTVAKPAIETAYKNIVNLLHQIAPKHAGINHDDRMRTFLTENSDGNGFGSIEGSPEFKMLEPTQIRTKPIVYAIAVGEADIKPNLFRDAGRMLTKIDDVQAMLLAAQTALETSETRGDIITEDEEEDTATA